MKSSILKNITNIIKPRGGVSLIFVLIVLVASVTVVVAMSTGVIKRTQFTRTIGVAEETEQAAKSLGEYISYEITKPGGSIDNFYTFGGDGSGSKTDCTKNDWEDFGSSEFCIEKEGTGTYVVKTRIQGGTIVQQRPLTLDVFAAHSGTILVESGILNNVQHNFGTDWKYILLIGMTSGDNEIFAGGFISKTGSGGASKAQLMADRNNIGKWNEFELSVIDQCADPLGNVDPDDDVCAREDVSNNLIVTVDSNPILFYLKFN